MDPRARAAVRAFDANSALSIGLTATAARERRTIQLGVQHRGGRPHFRTYEDLPRGWTDFAAYTPGVGWRFSLRFLSRDDRRYWKTEWTRRRGARPRPGR